MNSLFELNSLLILIEKLMNYLYRYSFDIINCPASEFNEWDESKKTPEKNPVSYSEGFVTLDYDGFCATVNFQNGSFTAPAETFFSLSRRYVKACPIKTYGASKLSEIYKITDNRKKESVLTEKLKYVKIPAKGKPCIKTGTFIHMGKGLYIQYNGETDITEENRFYTYLLIRGVLVSTGDNNHTLLRSVKNILKSGAIENFRNKYLENIFTCLKKADILTVTTLKAMQLLTYPIENYINNPSEAALNEAIAFYSEASTAPGDVPSMPEADPLINIMHSKTIRAVEPVQVIEPIQAVNNAPMEGEKYQRVSEFTENPTFEKINPVTVRFMKRSDDITLSKKELFRLNDYLAVESLSEGNIYYSPDKITFFEVGYFFNEDYRERYVNTLKHNTNAFRDSFLKRIEKEDYFNKVELELAKVFGLYDQCHNSRLICLKNREIEKKEREAIEKERATKQLAENEQEKEREAELKAALKAKKEKFFIDNSDILKADLSDFEKITAYNELNKLYRFDGVVKSVLDLIREGYTTKKDYFDEYASRKINGEYRKLLRPKRECFLNNGSGGYKISAKLFDVLCFDNLVSEIVPDTEAVQVVESVQCTDNNNVQVVEAAQVIKPIRPVETIQAVEPIQSVNNASMEVEKYHSSQHSRNGFNAVYLPPGGFKVSLNIGSRSNQPIRSVIRILRDVPITLTG